MIRAARDDDYAAYRVLHHVLVPEDPIPPFERWRTDIMSTIQVAERDGVVVGYVDCLLFDGGAHVRNLVVDPSARGSRVGAELMHGAAARCRASGITSWHLNVAEDNEPAIRLYEKLGFRADWRSASMVMPWDATRALPCEPADASPIFPEDGERIETEFGLIGGRMQTLGRRSDRVMLQLANTAGDLLGMAVFDPGFPGASIFRVKRPALAGTLFAALRPHAQHDYLLVLVEGDDALTILLEDAGARVRRRIQHMSASVPDEQAAPRLG
jgi:GNAT superfamily N-acetyltransferase